MGSIYRRKGQDGKPTGPWKIAYVDNRGVQRHESSRIPGRPGTGKSHEAAKRLLAEREAAIGKGAPAGATGRRTFADCLQDVLRDQQSNERRDLRHTKIRIEKHLAPFFHGYRVGDVTTAVVRRYTAERKDAGVKPATINRELAIVRRALRLAVRNGDVLTPPHIELLDESRNVRRGIIEPHDFARVLQHITPPVYRDVADLAFITGWRTRSELLPLQWGQVDLRAAILRLDVGQSKAGEGRTFPMTSHLLTIFKRRRKAFGKTAPAAGALVFTEDDGQAISDSRFYDRWHVACKKAGFPDLIPHDLRRSAIREMERRRIPRQVAMKLVGHRTESIYRRYALVNETDIQDARDRLEERPAGKARRQG